MDTERGNTAYGLTHSSLQTTHSFLRSPLPFHLTFKCLSRSLSPCPLSLSLSLSASVSRGRISFSSIHDPLIIHTSPLPFATRPPITGRFTNTTTSCKLHSRQPPPPLSLELLLPLLLGRLFCHSCHCQSEAFCGWPNSTCGLGVR